VYKQRFIGVAKFYVISPTDEVGAHNPVVQPSLEVCLIS
jgi:hypothetical protein